jgi:outer membrane protein TolC
MKNEALNELASSVVADYLRWYFAGKELSLYNQAVAMSNDRLRAVREEFLAGAKPISDTIETAAQLGSFLVLRQEAEIEYAKAKLLFSAHLWNSDGLPVEPLPGIQPEFAGLDFLDSLVAAFPDSVVVEDLLQLQPELGNMAYLQQELELERRFKKQQLLPDLSLKYNVLAPGWMNFAGLGSGPLNNYTFGLKFSTSLFLRKERGEYRLADYKWQGQGLKVAWKTRESTQKVRAAYIKVLTYRDILSQMQGLTENYETLYENEKIRFESGDATVFMVNTRETKLIETRIKQLNYLEKNLLSQNEYLEKSGILWQILR